MILVELKDLTAVFPGYHLDSDPQASSETQGQLVGAGKNLNGREKN